MNTVDAIFEAFGGPAALGRAIGIPTEHAAQMKRRKSIPVRWWPKLVAAAKEKGIPLTDADLIAIHAPFSGAGGTELNGAAA